MNLGFTLAKDEIVIRKTNRHWVALVPVIAAAITSILVAVGMTYLFGRYRSSFPSSMTGAGLIVFDVFMLVFALVILYAGFWIWQRNYLLLTNLHLIRVEQKGLFARSVSQLALARIQDVSGTVPGFMATVFGYGNLTVETAGAEDNFVFNTIYTPADVASACLKAHEAYVPSVEAKEPIEVQVPPHQMPIPTSMTAKIGQAIIPSAKSIPAPEPIVVPEPLPTPPLAPEPEPVPAPEPAPVPVAEPLPDGPIPLAESVTATIEHHDQ